MNQQIVKTEPRDYHDIISKVASMKDVDIEKLQKLMTMQEEWEKRAAQLHYNECMAVAQAAMTQISKDSSNPQTRSRYASLEALDAAIRPHYTGAGFSISFNDETPAERPDWLRLVAYVSNGSDTRTFTKWMPVGNVGIRGQAMMTPTHAAIAAVTYGRRALLKMIFNLAEVDTDGNLMGGERFDRKTGEITPGPYDNKITTGKLAPPTTDEIISVMQGAADHTTLYAYKTNVLPTLWKGISEEDRKRIGDEYTRLMNLFSEGSS